ncbi:MAG: hypothetical protein E5X04_00590, partial [Mesorhizobium sp.]
MESGDRQRHGVIQVRREPVFLAIIDVEGFRQAKGWMLHHGRKYFDHITVVDAAARVECDQITPDAASRPIKKPDQLRSASRAVRPRQV